MKKRDLVGNHLEVRTTAAVGKEGFVVTDCQRLLGFKCVDEQALDLVLRFLVASVGELFCEFVKGEAPEEEFYPLVELLLHPTFLFDVFEVFLDSD